MARGKLVKAGERSEPAKQNCKSSRRARSAREKCERSLVLLGTRLVEVGAHDRRVQSAPQPGLVARLTLAARLELLRGGARAARKAKFERMWGNLVKVGGSREAKW